MDGYLRVLGFGLVQRSLQAMDIGAEVCAVGSRPGLPMRRTEVRGVDFGE